MHHRLLWGLGIVLLTGSLSAGCSCTGDPRMDGYSCGKSAIATGTYANRVNEKKESLENTADEKVQQQRQLDDLQAQQQSQKQDIDKVSGELATLDSELNALNSKIGAARSNKSVNQQKLADLQKSINSVKQQTSLAQADTISPPADRQAELQRLQQKYASLQKELLLLTGGS